jgi:hypothetical protein
LISNKNDAVCWFLYLAKRTESIKTAKVRRCFYEVTLKKFVLAAAVMWIPAVAHADDESVKHAYAMCQAMDNTGLPSQPCEVSGWNRTVTVTIDMVSSEARTFCQGAAAKMHELGARFQGGWTLQIKSPYSGGSSIAYCSL